jgi:hypothetical protein
VTLSFVAEGLEAERLGGEAIRLAQAIDPPWLEHLPVAAIELRQPAIAKNPDGVMNIAAAAVGGIEQDFGPIVAKKTGQGVGRMVVAEGDVRVGAKSEFAAESTCP